MSGAAFGGAGQDRSGGGCVSSAVASEIFAVFCRKRLFGYKRPVQPTPVTAGLSMTVWAHMCATGAELLPVFSFMTFLIAARTGTPTTRLGRIHLERATRPTPSTDDPAVVAGLYRTEFPAPSAVARQASCRPSQIPGCNGGSPLLDDAIKSWQVPELYAL